MKLAVVTDVHIGPVEYKHGKPLKLTAYAEPLTRQFVDWAKALGVDAVLNLGDVIQDESHASDAKNYSRFCELVASIGVPVVHVAGNHDRMNLSEAELVRAWGRQGPAHYSLDLGGFHFAVLSTVWDHPNSVWLPQEQIEWLRSDLAATELPAVVLSHQPLSEMNLADSHWFSMCPQMALIRERERVREVISQSGKVILALSGHVHWNHLQVHCGVPYLTIQSLTENVNPDGEGRPAGTHALLELNATTIRVTVYGEQPCRYDFATDRASGVVLD